MLDLVLILLTVNHGQFLAVSIVKAGLEFVFFCLKYALSIFEDSLGFIKELAIETFLLAACD